ncbi:DsrE/DsrF/TusD sulfur relay family protein [Candidatus Borrarchaeum sp.]|uniref:DsrE/DsrF/TusD sulfur relay family protein n=1 Tax=Candidatus Borrarchaeum sp. TaxID=2846742 RepID=UPI0025800079|nr:DsrE family protein [Candidatus Borrarchaeum sp.]
MGTLSILLTTGPYTSQNTDTVIEVTKAAVKRGHEVMGIYLFMDGVLNTNKDIDSLSDEERNIARLLEELTATGVKIFSCPVCCSYRGIKDEKLLIEGATFDGLGGLSELVLDSDRFLVFSGY